MSADDGFWESFLVIRSEFHGWVCVFDAFLDETHKQNGQRMTSVGGFLFRKESIAPLKRELADLLQNMGIKKPFSAADCNAQNGEFSSWRYDDCQRFLANISARVAKHRGIGVICTVNDDDFYSWAASSPHNAHWFGVPYSLCALVAIDIVRQYLDDEGSDDDVFYSIEAGANGRKQAEDFLRRIDTNPILKKQYRLRGYTFIDKKGPDGLPLLSADLLVWSWQRNHLEVEIPEMRGSSGEEWTTPFKRLFQSDDTLPICYARLGINAIRREALTIALQNIAMD